MGVTFLLIAIGIVAACAKFWGYVMEGYHGPSPGAKVIEFKSLPEYEQWLRRQGASVRVVNTTTTKRWSLLTGFLGSAKTYTVTYENVLGSLSTSAAQAKPAERLKRRCPYCAEEILAEAILCRYCGRDLPKVI